tara:strand:+ start:6178 stop:6387 length:210 start_codon:yes stop_codon:yes gene_type:complete
MRVLKIDEFFDLGYQDKIKLARPIAKKYLEVFSDEGILEMVTELLANTWCGEDDTYSEYQEDMEFYNGS